MIRRGVVTDIAWVLRGGSELPCNLITEEVLIILSCGFIAICFGKPQTKLGSLLTRHLGIIHLTDW